MIETDIELLKGIANQLRIHSITPRRRRAAGIRLRAARRRTLWRRCFSATCVTTRRTRIITTMTVSFLSKGHAAPLLYAAWAENGFIPVRRTADAPPVQQRTRRPSDAAPGVCGRGHRFARPGFGRRRGHGAAPRGSTSWITTPTS